MSDTFAAFVSENFGVVCAFFSIYCNHTRRSTSHGLTHGLTTIRRASQSERQFVTAVRTLETYASNALLVGVVPCFMSNASHEKLRISP